MQDITNKSVLITGGSKGIGKGIANVLIKKGANVAITSRSKKEAEEVAIQLNKFKKGMAMGICSDVRDPDTEKAAVEMVLSEWGTLDVVIANAGVGHFASIEELTKEKWNETIDINLTGVFNTVKASIPALKKSEGYIITIASLAGTNFFAGGSAYNASKFGLVGFSQAIMLDLRQYGIKVTTIMPGSVSSYFNDHLPDESDAWKIQPVDIGEIVVSLLEMHPRCLPSKIEVRPTRPSTK